MGIFLKVLKEIGIAIAIIAVIGLAAYIAFREQIPYGKDVPKGDAYAAIDKKVYSVSSNDRLTEVKAITVIHETNSNQIIDAENEVRIQTGKYTPFGTISTESDLPDEIVDSTVTITPGTAEDTTTDETLVYPSTGDATVDAIMSEHAADQNQDPEQVAKDRMGITE